MKHSPAIQMTFECNQNWDAMQMTSCGRYCDVCKKNVIDFTNKTKEDYFALYEKDPQLCGRFRPEQVDLSLIAPVRFPFSRKMIIWFSGLLLTFSYENTKAQTESVSTEQTGSVNPDLASNDKPGTISIKKYDSPPTPDFSNIDRGSYFSPTSRRPFYKSKKKMYYWTWRFPFITVTHRGQRMGMSVRFL